MNVFRIGYSDAKGSRRQTLRTGEPTSYARPLLEWSVSSARVVIFTLIALVIVWYGVQIGLIGSDEPVEEEGGVAGSRRG